MAEFPTFNGSRRWPWIGSCCIPSCISHRPPPTYQILLNSKKLFVDGRADGHLRPTLIGRLGGVDLKTKQLRRNDPENRPWRQSWRKKWNYGLEGVGLSSCQFPLCQCHTPEIQLDGPWERVTSPASPTQPGHKMASCVWECQTSQLA